MYSREPQSPRLVVLVMALVSAVAVMPMSGQESTQAIESRVSDSEPSPFVAPMDPHAGETRKQGVDLGVVLSAAYDDNIFLSSDDAKSDLVLRAAPSIGYRKGDRETQDGGYIKAAYRPTGVIYTQGNGDNRVDHEAALQVGFRGKSMSFDYTGAYGKLGDATADTGREADRKLVDHVIRIAWIPREKLALELAAGQSIADYADKLLLDSHEAFGEVALRYAYSPKTRLGLVYRAGRFQVDDSDDQTFHRLTASMEWQPREKLRVEVAAGAEKRKYSAGSSVTPVLEGRVNWTPSEKTAFYLNAYRREMASAFSVGQNYRLTGVTAGVSHKLNDKWSARLEAGYERAAYRQVDGTDADTGTDRLWFVRPSIEYRFTEQLGLEIFYRVASNDSSRAGFGYDQQTAGVLLDYKF